MIKIDLITGFLGAGKTTFIQKYARWLMDQGQKIGEVGNTGNSFGSHCHFEITVNGKPVDPFNYL